MKLIISLLITLSTLNVERGFSFLTLLLNKLRNAVAPNSSDKRMQLILFEPHIDNLGWGEITDLTNFQRNCTLGY